MAFEPGVLMPTCCTLHELIEATEIKFIRLSDDISGLVPDVTIVDYKPNGGPIFRLNETIAVEIMPGIFIVIPIGFLFDGASIPRFAWSFIGSPAGPYLLAALIHDILFMLQLPSFEFANEFFHDVMVRLKIKWARRSLMYAAVKYAGKKAYYGSDERGILFRLYPHSFRWNPYTSYTHVLYEAGIEVEFNFGREPWQHMSDEEFGAKYVEYIKNDRIKVL